MDGGRGFRGWLAATTVAVTLTLVFLAVEKHIRVPKIGFLKAAKNTAIEGVLPQRRGVLLSIDPGLAGVERFYPRDAMPIVRKTGQAGESLVAGLLRRPPEPAPNVVLQAPVVPEQFTALPLHGSSSKIDYLMQAMDKALESPMHVASSQRVQVAAPHFAINADRLASLPIPASMARRIPEPKNIYVALTTLEQMVDSSAAMVKLPSANAYPGKFYEISHSPSSNITTLEAQQIRNWVIQSRASLDQIVVHHGLEHSASAQDLRNLSALAGQATDLANSLSDYNVAKHLIGVGYALQRRVAVWQAIQACLDRTSIALTTPRDPEIARGELSSAIRDVAAILQNTGDSKAWRKYLLLDELTAWVESPQDIWTEGNSLALSVLSRLHWQRLNESQQRFLAYPVFEELASHLLVWGREPVDYRQLLTELEMLEEDSISRVSGSIAGALQTLRLSREEQQRQIAAALNDHYRNANIRLSLSEELIQRVLPKEQVDVRPVRQRILDADTAGDSSIRTELKVKLIADQSAWNIGLGVLGDMVSMTRSSKGPAVFHNTSTAHIDSYRYIRLDPMGYQVTSEPTQVASQDYLRRMSTDFDSLPIIGDLARFLVREQFDQKRGLAQRITRRIIAQEADAELDRRLEENLRKAEDELKKCLVGPLERLNLNPMVVAMSTTEDRLIIRYRVANEAQMAANTPRPRAPSDSLMSIQLHQSAINNTIAQIGLSGRDWTLPELRERLGQATENPNWELSADASEEEKDISIRFADSRPVTVELLDGKLRLTMRIAEFRLADQLRIERFIVSTNYVPVVHGMTADLVRDGVVEIMSKNNHDRLRLRVIFARIFLKVPQIPLISESWSADPRAVGLAVSQAEIRDGWLALAVSKSDSAMVAELPKPSIPEPELAIE